MGPSSSSCVSLSSGRRSLELELEPEVEAVMDILKNYQDGDFKKGEFYHELRNISQGTLAKCILTLCYRVHDCDDENERNIELCDALRRKNEYMKCSLARLKCGIAHWKSRALNSCNSYNTLQARNNELNFSLVCLKSEK